MTGHLNCHAWLVQSQSRLRNLYGCSALPYTGNSTVCVRPYKFHGSTTRGSTATVPTRPPGWAGGQDQHITHQDIRKARSNHRCIENTWSKCALESHFLQSDDRRAMLQSPHRERRCSCHPYCLLDVYPVSVCQCRCVSHHWSTLPLDGCLT